MDLWVADRILFRHDFDYWEQQSTTKMKAWMCSNVSYIKYCLSAAHQQNIHNQQGIRILILGKHVYEALPTRVNDQSRNIEQQHEDHHLM
eukprot:4541634-Ditylum_brightwellii.AAC.1